jgi:tetratricopeptide (TPR) repeat protein
LAALFAYRSSLHGEFSFDDLGAIVDNPTIRHLWPIWDALSPPPTGAGVVGRPLVNLSFALNYAVGGSHVWGYHAVNLAIHVLAGLTLFGIMRRTWLLPAFSRLFPERQVPLALAVALLWTVHPLVTESVSSVVQRSESLVGLFYLVTLYCFIRSLDAPVPRRWQALAVGACLLGMATKEVMVTAPLLVLLYDRSFVAGSFRQAWRERRTLYLGLAGTSVLLAYLVLGNAGRNQTVGFGLGVSWWAYALTQCWAMVEYLRLSVWPVSLVFDYGTEIVTAPEALIPRALLLAVLLCATIAALRRRSPFGFLGAWFFLILAPSSSVVPLTTQTVAEHRMYLPLIAVMVVTVLAAQTLLRQRAIPVLAVLGVLLAWQTVRRNQDYRTAISIWTDTVTKRPRNQRAHNNLGNALCEAGRVPEALEHYRAARRIQPDFHLASFNLGHALLEAGQTGEAVLQLQETLRQAPDYVKARNALGNALVKLGRVPEAIQAYREVLRIAPDFHEAHYNLGQALLLTGQLPEAILEYQQMLRVRPDHGEARSSLGVALAQAGRLEEAVVELEQAKRQQPGSPTVFYNSAKTLAQAGRLTEAIGDYEQAVRLKPDYAEAYYNLGNALVEAHRLADAASRYEEAVRLRSDYAEAYNNLGTVLLRMGRPEEARDAYQRALAARPDYAKARENLARLGGR